MNDPKSVQPGPGQQLTKFACLDCRRVFKRTVADIGKRNWPRPIEILRCPACGGDSYLMSSDFKAPPRGDLRKWEVVALLVRAGLPYFRLYETVAVRVFGSPAAPESMLSAQASIGPYPETLAEARAFIARHRDEAQPFVRAEG